MRRILYIGIPALLIGMLLQAATLERLSLDDMARKSSVIVRGRVMASFAEQHRDIIYTHYRVQVVESWKGSGAGQLDVVLPGGVLPTLRQEISGAPQLSAGKEYVLFLWTGPSGLTHVIGLSQGVFDVKRSAAGEIMAYRGATSAAMMDAKGRPVRDLPITMRLSDLKTTVRTSLGQAGGAR